MRTELELVYLRAAEELHVRKEQDLKVRVRKMQSTFKRKRLKILARSTAYQRAIDDSIRVLKKTCAKLSKEVDDV